MTIILRQSWRRCETGSNQQVAEGSSNGSNGSKDYNVMHGASHALLERLACRAGLRVTASCACRSVMTVCDAFSSPSA